MPDETLSGGGTDQQRTDSATAAVLFFLAETATHPGAPDGTPGKDSPIQRSVHTGWPVVWDTTLKGALKRAVTSRKDKETAFALFGDEKNAGRIAAPDADLLLFPVTSARGVAAWTTCRLALEYFVRRLSLYRAALHPTAQEQMDKLTNAVDALDDGAFVTSTSEIDWNDDVVISESDVHKVTKARGKDDPADIIADWLADALPATRYWRDRLRSHLAIIDEKAFSRYAKRKTDNRTRIALSEGVVDAGPWTEENIPIDTLLYTVASVSAEALDDSAQGSGTLRSFVDAMHLQDAEPVITLGGDQSLARGNLRIRALRPRGQGEP